MMRSLRQRTCALLSSSVSVNSVWQCVEELVRNSVGAGANLIEVLVDCSSFFVKVSDNGEGIQTEVLSAVGEFSHRPVNEGGCTKRMGSHCGNGWSAICNVSTRMEIVTRQINMPATLSKTLAGGHGSRVILRSQSRTYPGTEISVFGLFARLPVRQRRIIPAAEMRNVRRGLTALSLVFPSISFVLVDQNACATVLRLSPAQSVTARFTEVFAHVSDQQLETIDYNHRGCQVAGCVSVGLSSRRSRQFVFVNGREVRQTPLHDLINKLLLQLLIPPTESAGTSNAQYGIFAILITCPNSDVDICFDPDKTLVEFSDWSNIENCLWSALSLAFDKPNESHYSGCCLYTGNRPAKANTEKEESVEAEVPVKTNIYQSGLVSKFAHRANSASSHVPVTQHSKEDRDGKGSFSCSLRKSPPQTAKSSQQPDMSTSFSDTTEKMLWESVYDETRCEFVRVQLRSGICFNPAQEMPAIALKTNDSVLEESVIIDHPLLKHPYMDRDEDCPAMHLTDCRLSLKLLEEQAHQQGRAVSRTALHRNSTLQQQLVLLNSSLLGQDVTVSSEIAKQFFSWKNPVFPTRQQGYRTPLRQIHQMLPTMLRPMHCDRSQLQGAQVVGQVACKFIACLVSMAISNERDKWQRHIMLVDQHAAHERVRLEELENHLLVERPGHGCSMAACQRRKCCMVIQSSPVSPHLAIKLGLEESNLCMVFEKQLLHIGVSLFQGQSGQVLVDHVPSVLKHADKFYSGEENCPADVVTNLIRDEIAFWSANGGHLRDIPPVLRHELASQACHGAIRFGDNLNIAECSDLLSKLAICRLPFQCAHGRPSVAPLLALDELLQNSAQSFPQLYKLHMLEKACLCE